MSLNSKVQIVIPVYNRPDMVSRIINSMKNTEAVNYLQLFVDDGSEKETTEMILKYVLERPGCVEYLRNLKQQLFTRTVNRGFRASIPNIEYLVEVNTDCILLPGWLDKLINVLDVNPKAAIVGYPNSSDCERIEKVDYPNYITGHCIAIRRTALEDIGTFCETDLQQAHIASERIWCWKAVELGWEMYYVHSPVCLHEEGTSWNHNLHWLFSEFDYSQLWKGRDTL